MGKTKHKKHHRDENGGDDETNAGLKLVLKVGSKGHEKHKKKKKKKDKKKERNKERGKHHHHHKVLLQTQTQLGLSPNSNSLLWNVRLNWQTRP